MTDTRSITQGGRRVTVIGGGAFGTALACAAVRAGQCVHLWGRDADVMADVRNNQRNTHYLPDIALPDSLQATSQWAAETVVPDILLLVTPAQTTQTMVEQIADTPSYGGVPIVLCAKGINQSDGRLLSEIVRAQMPEAQIGMLSGPSFATDIARGLPTAVSVAADDLSHAEWVGQTFSGSGLRCYATNDIRGVELGGALKNVMAIAAGIVAGRKLGASAQAALVTRGLVEMRRLAVAMGAQPDTLSGLSGLGDLILTCASTQSRNFSYGVAVGTGTDLNGLPLAEGVYTAGIATKLADDHGVDVPIISTVSAVLDKRLTVDDAINGLLARPLKVEQ